MQQILGDDYVADEQIANDGKDTIPIRVNVVNLNDLSKTMHCHEVSFVNLLNTQTKQQATKKLLTTFTTPGSIGVNWKQNNALSLVVETIDKNNKVMVEAMD
jgi:Cdc6-like AAA superfamily ATPase